MDNELDINKVTAEFLSAQIDSFFDAAKGMFSGATAKIRAKFKADYTKYLDTTIRTLSFTKSFFIRTEPTFLYDFYVPLGLKIGKTVYSKPKFAELVDESKRFVVTGQAGSGKSMMMKHLAINAIESNTQLPIFIELRTIKNAGQTIEEAILSQLIINGLKLDENRFREALKLGHFAILLDGFDEVVHSKRCDLSAEIQSLSVNYPLCSFIVSSRPDTEFRGWQTFVEACICPLNLELAKELIVKLPFDDDIKGRFVTDLEGGVFKKHESFLSNPLLLSIMLLTYGECAEIPNKLSVFYYQAYEALFQKHDAYKGAYRRTRKTLLDIQDFATVFSSFCIQSYDNRETQMTEETALKYLDKARDLTGIEFNSRDFLTDAIQAVCLLLEDGLFLAFAHRSFQEFFAAKFISNVKEETQCKLLERYSKDIQSDSVFELLYEMSPEVVEKHYILPTIKELKKFIGMTSKLNISHYAKYVKNTIPSYNFVKNCFYGSGEDCDGKFPNSLSFIIRNCGHYVGWKGYKDRDKCLKALVDKYSNADGTPVQINTSKMNSRSPFIRDLAINGIFFSIETLNVAFQIEEAIEKKLAYRQSSLSEILGV